MSELTTLRTTRAYFHWQLMATVSALALCTTTCLTSAAKAEDADRSTVWIELGAQLERMSGQNSLFVPDFMHDHANSPAFTPVSPLAAQKLPRYDKGFEGRITLTPNGSDWVFSAALRYGRANGNKRIHQQTPGKSVPSGYPLHGYENYNPVNVKALMDVRSRDSESHTLVDFRAGKDVGLGSGKNSTSSLSFGLRYAQFSSSKEMSFLARPEIFFHGFAPFKYWSKFAGAGESTRSFQGIGPSVSWDGSAVLAGNPDDSVAFDWGLSGAVLFGRQKASVLHSTIGTEVYSNFGHQSYTEAYRITPPRSVRRRSVVVPNLGGFAGISFRRANAKVSFGYRGDFFFGAMDTGIDHRKTENMSFHGPFATISIGLGG